MLGAAIADLAFVALVAAFSPFPLVAAIGAAGAAEPAAGPAFAAGWVAGLGSLSALLFFVAGEVDPSRITPDAWVQILVGGGLIAAAAWKWRTRPRRGEAASVPRWMASFDGGAARAFGIGAALGGVNPKNLAIAAAGAAIAHSHHLAGARLALATVAFVAVGSSTVIAIVAAAAFGGQRIGRLLDALKMFMLRYSNPLVAIVLAGIGAKLVVTGALLLLG